jgi:enoyl-CoA hydratase/carnithine racemase
VPELNDLTELPGEVANIARDAAYVFVGLGVLGFQRAQVQRVELQSKLATDLTLDERMTDLREAVANGFHQVDELVESAIHFVEATIAPIEEQLPTVAREVAKRAHDQAREIRTQLRELVAPAA